MGNDLLEEARLSLNGKVVIQGLVFDWVCTDRATLKVSHRDYGLRVVQLKQFAPDVLAKLVALSMIVRVTETEPADSHQK